MAWLEDLTTGTRLTGLAASGTSTVESAQWIGEQAAPKRLRVHLDEGRLALTHRTRAAGPANSETLEHTGSGPAQTMVRPRTIRDMMGVRRGPRGTPDG